MTVAVRLIPCLDVKGGRVVKGVNFEGLRDAERVVDAALAEIEVLRLRHHTRGGDRELDEAQARTRRRVPARHACRVSRDPQRATGRAVADWAAEAEDRGAGEILLTSMDRDGTLAGYDLELLRAVRDAVSVPVIASGGAGTLDHLVDAVTEGGADAVLAASIFHDGTYTLMEAKKHLAARGLEVRL